jgi:translation initiation factor 2D
MTEIRALLNSYITTQNLVNPREQAYINLDDLLYSCVSSKTKGKAKSKDVEPEPTMSRFMKRDQLTKTVLEKMQSWYEIRVEGKDPVSKYAKLLWIFAYTNRFT